MGHDGLLRLLGRFASDLLIRYGHSVTSVRKLMQRSPVILRFASSPLIHYQRAVGGIHRTRSVSPLSEPSSDAGRGNGAALGGSRPERFQPGGVPPQHAGDCRVFSQARAKKRKQKLSSLTSSIHVRMEDIAPRQAGLLHGPSV